MSDIASRNIHVVAVILNTRQPQLRILTRHPDGGVPAQRAYFENMFHARGAAVQSQELGLCGGDGVAG